MKPFYRHLKFFTKTSELYFLILILLALFFTFLQSYSTAVNGMRAADILAGFANQLIFYTAIVNLVLPVNCQFQFFPLVLSINATRKHTFLGYQWGAFLLSLQAFLVALILNICAKTAFSDALLSLVPVYTGILFGSMGVGGLLAGICGHFGKAELWIMMLICGLVGGIVGYASVSFRDLSLATSDGSMTATFQTVTVFGMDLRIFITLVLGIAVYLIGNTIHYLLIRKIAVRI